MHSTGGDGTGSRAAGSRVHEIEEMAIYRYGVCSLLSNSTTGWSELTTPGQACSAELSLLIPTKLHIWGTAGRLKSLSHC